MNLKFYGQIAAAMASMSLEMFNENKDRSDEIKEARKRYPWDNINLTKSERRGKSYNEIQMIRKVKYEKLSSEVHNNSCADSV